MINCKAQKIIFDDAEFSGYCEVDNKPFRGWVCHKSKEIVNIYLHVPSLNQVLNIKYGCQSPDILSLLGDSYINSANCRFLLEGISFTGVHDAYMQVICSGGDEYISCYFTLIFPLFPINFRDMLQYFEKCGTEILEIGPFSAPFFSGSNVKYFDIYSADELRERCAYIDGYSDSSKVPKIIHYVSSSGDFTIVDRTFDLIFSSHVIEHTVDFVAHLKTIETILNDQGLYVVIIPDKDFIFDCFRNLSTISDVLSAYYEKHKLHSLKSFLEQELLMTHNDPIKHWYGDNGFVNTDYFSEKVRKVCENYSNNNYSDCHKWVFSSSSFIKIVTEIQKMALVNLNIVGFYPACLNSGEFCVIFQK